MHAKILVVIFPEAEELIDDGFLLVSAPRLGNVPRVFDHGYCVEIGARTVDDGEEEIQEWIPGCGILDLLGTLRCAPELEQKWLTRKNSYQPVCAYPEKCGSKYAS